MRLPRRAALGLLGMSPWLLRGGFAAPAPDTATLPSGITQDGQHYLGRADAPVTLVEYGDFL